MSKNNRDNFLESVKRDLRDRVGSHCSNPDCDVLTIAASNESNSSINNIGIAAHICAAASGKGARRYKPEPEMTSEQRSSIDNGIWLCASCATMIDKDEVTYTEALLQQWKLQAEERAKYRRGKKLYDQKEIEAIVAPHVKQHHLDTEQIKGLTVAVTALSQKGELGTAAIEAFKQDNLSLAKDLFKLETQRAEMAAKQGAEAYRNLGAIAFLDNTQEALNAYRRATELEPDNADGWNELGRLLQRIGELDNATAAYQKVLALGQSHQDQQEMAMAYGNLGLVYTTRSDLDKAIAMHSKALAIDEQMGNKQGMAEDYGNLGLVYKIRGELTKSVAMHSKALAINQALGIKSAMADNYGNLGLVYHTRGELDKAVEMHTKALSLNQELGKEEGIAQNYGNLGIVYYALGELDKAVAMYNKGLVIEESLGLKEGIAVKYGNLGIVYAMRSELDKAVAMFNKALAINQKLGKKEGMTQNYVNLGVVYVTRGELDKAVEMYQKSLAITENLGLKEGMANTYANLGLVYQQKRNKAEAKRYFQKSIELYKYIGSPNAEKVQGWLDALQ